MLQGLSEGSGHSQYPQGPLHGVVGCEVLVPFDLGEHGASAQKVLGFHDHLVVGHDPHLGLRERYQVTHGFPEGTVLSHQVQGLEGPHALPAPEGGGDAGVHPQPD